VAYFAALLYHRLILLYWPDPAKYIPEALLIATLNLLVSIGHRQYSRIQTQPRQAFLWSGVGGVFLVFFFFLSTMFVLKHSEDYSRATVMVQAANVCTDVGGGLGAQALSNGYEMENRDSASSSVGSSAMVDAKVAAVIQGGTGWKYGAIFFARFDAASEVHRRR
jgi:hypothetical protein